MLQELGIQLRKAPFAGENAALRQKANQTLGHELFVSLATNNLYDEIGNVIQLAG